MGRKINKKEPPLINLEEGGQPIKGETCFNTCKKLNIVCDITDCRYNQEMKGRHQNCVINAAEEGPFTLQEVGDIFNVTRMRICQIEKVAKQLLKGTINNEQI